MVADLKVNTEKKPRLIFYFVLALLPLLFIILLELILVVTDYGTDTSLWHKKGNKYQVNPDLAYRYFHNVKTLPSTIEDIFDIEKKGNCYRVFVLGGSSAAGFPYMPMGSFSRYIRKRLEMNFPDSEIEVVNLSMSAVNSYTILDLIPGVIEQEPDAVLIYAGHNEYYGALGVGSVESIGNSRFIITAMLHLNRFKTVQFLRDMINLIVGSIENNSGERSGTLMSKMAENKTIGYGSETYNAGIDQFEENFEDIIELCSEAGVPLLLGTLTSNVKDQMPLSHTASTVSDSSYEKYMEALSVLGNNNIQSADSLFLLARDLDGLRFRAPGEINDVINSIGRKYDIPVMNIDSAFRSASNYNIVGSELMTDHVHPDLTGYQLMGKIYYNGLKRNGLLPDIDPVYPFEKQDSITIANFMISELDMRLAEYSIAKLKNDWPFIRNEDKKPIEDIIEVNSYLDSIAMQSAFYGKKWQAAHLELARNRLSNNDIGAFLKHMDILIYQYPVTGEIYDQVIHELLKREMHRKALQYLLARYELGTNAFISKWIGNIYYSTGERIKAIHYLNESLEINPHDPQALFNLCLAYMLEGQYEKGKEALRKCLEIAPDFPNAKEIYEEIKNM